MNAVDILISSCGTHAGSPVVKKVYLLIYTIKSCAMLGFGHNKNSENCRESLLQGSLWQFFSLDFTKAMLYAYLHFCIHKRSVISIIRPCTFNKILLH